MLYILTTLHIHLVELSINLVQTPAGDDGGVMLIGRLNCYVSIDEIIFDFNSAGDRGGVVAIIASSMKSIGQTFSTIRLSLEE